MQDMVARSAPSASQDSMDSEDEYVESEERPTRTRRGFAGRGGKRKTILGAVVLAVLLILGLLTSFFFQGAELTVYPKSKEVTVDAAFTASQNPEANALGYELLSLEETGERAVEATGTEPVEERATGEITISNAFSKEPQRLIKNTRFESKDGLIFKIQESVVIPGYTTEGNEKVPGTATAKVFADGTGDKYNVNPGRLTIPGLKGTPQFESMYAEPKAAMQGGFVGQKLIVEESALKGAKEAIQNDLRAKLSERLRNERPAGFVLYESAARIRFESLPSIDGGESKATIREKAVLEAPLFAEADLARYLAQNTIVDYKGENVKLENSQSLSFTYAATSTEAMAGMEKIDFKLSGNTKMIWTYDTEKLRADVAGTAKEELPSVLLSYQPAIQRATTVMRPFWKQSFPEDPADIKIIEVLEAPK